MEHQPQTDYKKLMGSVKEPEQISTFAERHMWSLNHIHQAMEIDWCVDQCQRREKFVEKLLSTNLGDMKIMVTKCI